MLDEIFFRIQETKEWLIENKFERIALQLPDSLLSSGFDLVQALKPFNTFLLADTSYGECCIDQQAAAHNGADCIIHYGNSCLSRPSFLPTLFSLCDLGKDLPLKDHSFHVLKEYSSIYIHIDVRYEGCRGKLLEILANIPTVDLSPPPPTELIPLSASQAASNEQNITDFAKYQAVVFVGPRVSPQIHRLSFLCAGLESCKMYTFDISSMEFSLFEANRALARRYVQIEKIKDSSIIGILIGTMSVSGYIAILERVKKIITDSGRKYYCFVFGKLTPSKLGNFPDVDSFVLIACALNTLIDSKEFNKPIVTPYELEVALNDRPWGTYAWEFSRLLSYEKMNQDKDVKEEQEQIHFSLSKGEVINRTKKKTVSTVALRYESPAAESLALRTFKGLEPTTTHLQPAKAVSGQIGIASKLFQLDDVEKQNPI